MRARSIWGLRGGKRLDCLLSCYFDGSEYDRIGRGNNLRKWNSS
jgi:hypothetical protein